MRVSIRQVAVLLSALVAFAGLAPSPAVAQTSASAPLAPATPGARTQPIPSGVPAGFEADTSFETVFDVDFQGVRIGSFKGTLANGVFRFSNPAAVVATLGDKVDRPKALALVSQGMNSNEAFRCVPGQKTNCDLLPPGISGVIVDPETFRVDLFLGREFLVATKAGPRLLPDPISGPSLVQGVMLAVSSDLIDQSGVHAGATLNTAASLGRNAFISQIAAGDQQGFQADQMYLQRVQGGWRAAAGLMTSPSESVLTNFNFVGADWASFQPTSLDNPNAGTPLDVLLPRHARVELYANGTLVSAQQYDGGLQLIDTSLLPTGSYNVRIIARDGSTVILDQTRPFTKAPNLPPTGKFVFDLAAGERVVDSFTTPIQTAALPGGDIIQSARQPFFPQTTGELVFRALAGHRVGGASALTADILVVGSNVYPEVSFQTYWRSFTGLLGVSVDTHGDYAALASGTALWHGASFNISLRSSDFQPDAAQLVDLKYTPYQLPGQSIYGSVTVPVGKGSLALTASYQHNDRTLLGATQDQYLYGLQYQRSMDLPRLGTALFTVGATTSQSESLVGFSFSFFKRIDRQTSLNYALGAEDIQAKDPSVVSGGGPTVSVDLSRTAEIAGADVIGDLSASTDPEQSHVQGEAQVFSDVGSAQLTANYQYNRVGGSSAPVTLNAETGFAVGGGEAKFGLRAPGQAVLLADIDREAPVPQPLPSSSDQAPTAVPGPSKSGSAGAAQRDAGSVASGSYRIMIDGQAYDPIDVGQRVAVGMNPYKDYSVTLQAVGAPTYDLDLLPKDMPIYPGNVVVVHWKAKHVVTMYGRLVDEAGEPLANARIDAGSDTTLTDDGGYFVITGPLDGKLVTRTFAGGGCKALPIAGLSGAAAPGLLLKVGDIVCHPH
jgi:hypothetical protein